MKPPGSIRARLALAAAVVLAAFVAAAGLAVQRAHEDGVRTAHFTQLQGTVYLLLAAAELDANGMLVMPAGFPEPRLSLPGSGLFASIFNVAHAQEWRSPSSVGASPPFQRGAQTGQWRYATVEGGGRTYLAASYGVNWAGRAAQSPLVLSVLEDKAALDRETGAFARTLWTLLGGAGVLLLLSQAALLQWGLAPLGRVARELRRIEGGEQTEVQGRYPAEIAALTNNLNALIGQERVRQTRYREALSYLAHSLKTPLAVLRAALGQPGQLPEIAALQVARMDAIVQHQLARAAATGAARFAPPVLLASVLSRIRDSLAKVYAGKNLAFAFECPPQLGWRVDEGDAFEILGNVLDNAAKWAAQRVDARLWQEGDRLRIQVDDDGPGFSDTQAVLALHVRGDEKVPGHGVGLAVVSDIVASYHGTLALGRSGHGGGRVDITLPASRAMDTAS